MDDANISFKILAVDDNLTNIKVIGSILRDAGYQVGYAVNGRQAIDILKEGTDFDLVLMDINMPELDGFEALTLIKKIEGCKHIPVIMLTAHSNIDTMVKGFDLGAVDYITKPFNSSELLSRVNTHLQLKYKTDQLRFYTRKLEDYNATKDKFFSIISHDLRNPFGALQIVGKMLKNSVEKRDWEKTHELTGYLNTTISSGFKLLDNLLQWSRSQAGKIEVNTMELYLLPIVEEVVEQVDAQAFSKKIQLVNEVADDCVAWADIDLLKTVLRNLLSNAIKYTPENGEVVVRSECHDAYAAILIKDTGVGLDPDTAGRLFRIDGNLASSPGTRGEDGTGMGLIICREFVEKMNGSIGAETEEGKGSTFWFSLPRELSAH